MIIRVIDLLTDTNTCNGSASGIRALLFSTAPTTGTHDLEGLTYHVLGRVFSALKRTIQLLGLVCLITIGACGGSDSSSNPDSTEPVFAVGIISSLNSITVNGTRYTTNQATVNINGQPANISDLKTGHYVSLNGTINQNDTQGTADAIEFEAAVTGPIQQLEPESGLVVVMGQRVLISTETEFDSGISPDSIAGLIPGSSVQVSGFANPSGDIVATRIESYNLDDGTQVVGRITDVNTGNRTLIINQLTVDYSNATLINLLNDVPINGMYLIVRGTLSEQVLIADEISTYAGLENSVPGDQIRVQGLVTDFSSSTTFNLNLFAITTDSSTRYINGTVNDLRSNSHIIVKGETVSSGDRILAREIRFVGGTSATETVTFDLSNFTEISVFSVFNVTVTQGPDFFIEVTIDSDIVDNLDVTQTGSRLNIGLLSADNNAQTIEAVVTMPVLNSIDLSGVVNVTLADFNQMQFTANVDGVSRLLGNSLMIGNLVGTVGGVSQLDFSNTAPLGSANIDISGVSSIATLNMDIGSTLTGSVSGVASRLSYYGTDVMVDVSRSDLSSVVKLGETRL